MKIFRLWIVLGFVLATGAIVPQTVLAGEPHEAVEQRVLSAIDDMTSYLQGAKTLSFKALVTTEDVSSTLQKLQFASQIEGSIQRPNHLYFEKKGYERVALWFDGVNATILDRAKNKFVRIPVGGTISDLIEKLENLGAEAPFAGLLHGNIREHIDNHVFKGDFYGDALIADITCNHLAMRQDAVDWQLWTVKDSGAPKKIVITSKLLAGMPQHSMLFKNISQGNDIPAGTFNPVIPEGAEEVTLSEEEKDILLQGTW